MEDTDLPITGLLHGSEMMETCSKQLIFLYHIVVEPGRSLKFNICTDYVRKASFPPPSKMLNKDLY